MKPIQRRSVQFRTGKFKEDASHSQRKPAAESLTDIFILILVILLNSTAFNFRHVMTFPITEYPLCITHSDGSGLMTEKRKLLNKLEELQDGFTETPLPLINVTLIDCGQFIHPFLSAIGKITSYGNFARTLLPYVCGSEGNEIHLLFDTYHPMPLKESDKKLRGADARPFLITGPEQAPRPGCRRLLQNGIFMDQLTMFLLKD